MPSDTTFLRALASLTVLLGGCAGVGETSGNAPKPPGADRTEETGDART